MNQIDDREDDDLDANAVIADANYMARTQEISSLGHEIAGSYEYNVNLAIFRCLKRIVDPRSLEFFEKDMIALPDVLLFFERADAKPPFIFVEKINISFMKKIVGACVGTIIWNPNGSVDIRVQDINEKH